MQHYANHLDIFTKPEGKKSKIPEPPDPIGPGPMSFEKIPRFGPEIGTLGTPGGSHGANFFLQNFSHVKLFRSK